jgi:hypothetical protein
MLRPRAKQQIVSPGRALRKRCKPRATCYRCSNDIFEVRCLRLPAVTKVVQWEGTT